MFGYLGFWRDRLISVRVVSWENLFGVVVLLIRVIVYISGGKVGGLCVCVI